MLTSLQQADTACIAREKDAAERDLAAAMPYLDAAMTAIDSINAQVCKHRRHRALVFMSANAVPGSCGIEGTVQACGCDSNRI